MYPRGPCLTSTALSVPPPQELPTWSLSLDTHGCKHTHEAHIDADMHTDTHTPRHVDLRTRKHRHTRAHTQPHIHKHRLTPTRRQYFLCHNCSLHSGIVELTLVACFSDSQTWRTLESSGELLTNPIRPGDTLEESPCHRYGPAPRHLIFKSPQVTPVCTQG